MADSRGRVGNVQDEPGMLSYQKARTLSKTTEDTSKELRS